MAKNRAKNMNTYPSSKNNCWTCEKATVCYKNAMLKNTAVYICYRLQFKCVVRIFSEIQKILFTVMFLQGQFSDPTAEPSGYSAPCLV